MKRICGMWEIALLVFFFCTLYAVRCTPVFAGEEKQKAVVSVNGVPITEAQVEEMTLRIIQATGYHKEVTPERKDKHRKEAIEKLIESELLYQEAVRLGMEAPQDEVRRIFDEQKKGFAKESDFADFLGKEGITEEGYQKRIARVLLLTRLTNQKIVEPSQITDAEVSDYYTANRAKFVEPEKIRIGEIFLHFPLEADEKTKAEKRETARGILDEAEKNPDFCELVEQYSEDAWRVKCGETGYLHKGRLDAVLEKEVWEMKPGEVKMVELERGVMIVRFLDRKPERKLSFDEVKTRLKSELAASKRKKTGDEFMNALRAKAKIEVY